MARLVRDIMDTEMPVVKVTSWVEDLHRLPVIEHGRLAGAVTRLGALTSDDEE
jgi:hypothetical protein